MESENRQNFNPSPSPSCRERGLPLIFPRLESISSLYLYFSPSFSHCLNLTVSFSVSSSHGCKPFTQFKSLSPWLRTPEISRLPLYLSPLLLPLCLPRQSSFDFPCFPFHSFPLSRFPCAV